MVFARNKLHKIISLELERRIERTGEIIPAKRPEARNVDMTRGQNLQISNISIFLSHANAEHPYKGSISLSSAGARWSAMAMTDCVVSVLAAAAVRRTRPCTWVPAIDLFFMIKVLRGHVFVGIFLSYFGVLAVHQYLCLK